MSQQFFRSIPITIRQDRADRCFFFFHYCGTPKAAKRNSAYTGGSRCVLR